MHAGRFAALAALLPLLSPSTARAFCGAYVGGATTNTESIVVVARQGRRTTLTLFNDYDDASGHFGYVMPVPAALSLVDVTTVDPEVIRRMDRYSAPRVVAYDCDDIAWTWVDDTAGGRWEGSAGGRGGGGGCGGPSNTSTPDFRTDTSVDADA